MGSLAIGLTYMLTPRTDREHRGTRMLANYLARLLPFMAVTCAALRGSSASLARQRRTRVCTGRSSASSSAHADGRNPMRRVTVRRDAKEIVLATQMNGGAGAGAARRPLLAALGEKGAPRHHGDCALPPHSRGRPAGAPPPTPPHCPAGVASIVRGTSRPQFTKSGIKALEGRLA